jgi:hypothetical protein
MGRYDLQNFLRMKHLFMVSLATTLMFAYGCSGSTKGNWTDEDKAQMRKEFNKERAELDQMLGKETTDKWLDCALEKMENKYENPAEADKDIKGAEQIGADCMKDIMGL